MANCLAGMLPLRPSYGIEPEVLAHLDGARNVRLLNIDIFETVVPSVLDRYFDLVFTIEVAEHIPRDRHEALFDFLVARAARWILFSGARPGQGGHGHIAEREEMDWRREFTDRGCRFDPALTALARNRCNLRNINHRQNGKRPANYIYPAQNRVCKMKFHSITTGVSAWQIDGAHASSGNPLLKAGQRVA
nr:hypothetical protein [Thiorhodococcus drewsii]